MLFKSDAAGQESVHDFDKMKLRQKVQELEDKVTKKRKEKKDLDVENEFYNKSTAIFISLHKLIKKGNEYCKRLTEERDAKQREAIRQAIDACSRKEKELEERLGKVMRKIKEKKQAEGGAGEV